VKQKSWGGGSGDDKQEELLPPSPPADTSQRLIAIDCSAPSAKRAKHLFKRCFEATFDPANMPGTEKILAPDSDEEDTGEAGSIFRRRNKQ